LFFWAAPKLLEIKEKEKKKEEPVQALINDIGTALRFVDEDFGERIASLKSLLANDEITFDLLWTIFPPKELVLAPDHGILKQPLAFPITSSGYAVRENQQKYFYAWGKVVTVGNLHTYSRRDFH
jgi:hypothetical protein